MRIRRLLLVAAGLLFAATGTASAQDGGKAGITIAYPAAIGLIWHVTDSVAIRPAFSFSHNSAESAGGLSESDGTSFGLDLGVLFYVKKYDNVRTYVSPRFQYAHSTSTSTSTSPQSVLPEFTSTANTTGGSGVFGAQYAPTSRFSVYGEVGLAYIHRHSESGISDLGVSKSNTFGTTAGVGVIFYP